MNHTGQHSVQRPKMMEITVIRAAITQMYLVDKIIIFLYLLFCSLCNRIRCKYRKCGEDAFLILRGLNEVKSLQCLQCKLYYNINWGEFLWDQICSEGTVRFVHLGGYKGMFGYDVIKFKRPPPPSSASSFSISSHRHH